MFLSAPAHELALFTGRNIPFFLTSRCRYRPMLGTVPGRVSLDRPATVGRVDSRLLQATTSEYKSNYSIKRCVVLLFREEYAMVFDDAVPVASHRWYLAWVSITGPNSDCGAAGQSVVVADDQ